jgi:prevent-host-death family protein
MAKKKLKDIPVSILKNELLEIVRAVEKGQSYQITKDKKPVALLTPIPTKQAELFNYSRIQLSSNTLDLPEEKWSFDSANIE